MGSEVELLICRQVMLTWLPALLSRTIVWRLRTVTAISRKFAQPFHTICLSCTYTHTDSYFYICFLAYSVEIISIILLYMYYFLHLCHLSASGYFSFSSAASAASSSLTFVQCADCGVYCLTRRVLPTLFSITGCVRASHTATYTGGIMHMHAFIGTCEGALHCLLVFSAVHWLCSCIDCICKSVISRIVPFEMRLCFLRADSLITAVSQHYMSG